MKFVKILKKTLFWPGIIFLALVTCAILGSLWFYLGGFSETKLKVASTLHLPLGKVDGDIIYGPEVLGQVEYLGGFSTLALSRIEQHYGLESLALERLKTEESEFEVARNKVFKTYADYQATRQKYGQKVADELFVLPYVYKNSLASWYSSRPELEGELHRQAEALLTELKLKADWTKMAEEYSEDGYSKFYGGDLGLVEVSETVPEYARQVERLPEKQPSLVYTRYGIHIIEVLEKFESEGKSYLHIREVVLRQTGFETWLAQELQNEKPRWFVRMP